MKNIKLSIVIVCALLSTVSFAAIEPSYKDVDLKERTSFKLDIIPGMPTRLVFPFNLDDAENDPTLKVSVPNSTVFKIMESEEKGKISRQNTLVIKAEMIEGGDRSNPVYSAIYLSVSGYHITIIARTVPLTSKKYYTDVFFNLSDDDRDYLISKKVDKRIEKMKKIYEEKEADLAKLARSEAIKNISQIALNEPDIYRIKEEFDIDLQDELRVELYVKEAFNYGDNYYVLSFDLENKSNSDIKLSSVDLKASEKEPAIPINTSLNCLSVLKARELVTCALVSEDKRLYKNEVMAISLTTDAGVGEVSW